jgi:NAD(P)-dependent dehydrogenase (short-subunit alcohol dehydrogenase family)
MKTWFITGASRGFGLLVAEEALRRGANVVATARKPEAIATTLDAGNGRLLLAPLDVTDPVSIQLAVEAAVDRFGRIDVLMNNAGHGIVGAIEEVTDASARSVFDVNVFGLLNVTRSVLPVMRGQRSGSILNLSSVAGQSAAPGWGIYSATKHAVEAVNEALRAEAGPLGIRCTAIEPGPFRTDFLDGSSLHTEGVAISDYDGTVGATRRWAEDTNHAQLGDPRKAAEIMVDIADAEDAPLRLPLGADCVARIEAKLSVQVAELDEWRAVSMSTALEH